MLYEMARRYDEWPGEDYYGSSARGAMKGWHKHGVCAESAWQYDARLEGRAEAIAGPLADAVRRPLGAYFRVNHKDLVAMHSAITEVGVLYATAKVHDRLETRRAPMASSAVDGRSRRPCVRHRRLRQRGVLDSELLGRRLGHHGFGHITYDDWLANGTDVVGRAARRACRHRERRGRTASAVRGDGERIAAATSTATFVRTSSRVGNDGQLRADGTYGTSAGGHCRDLRHGLPQHHRRLEQAIGKRRLLLYAHGGLVDEDAAVQTVADYRQTLLAAGIYPVAFSGRRTICTTLKDILEDALRRRRPEGILDASQGLHARPARRRAGAARARRPAERSSGTR